MEWKCVLLNKSNQITYSLQMITAKDKNTLGQGLLLTLFSSLFNPFNPGVLLVLGKTFQLRFFLSRPERRRKIGARCRDVHRGRRDFLLCTFHALVECLHEQHYIAMPACILQRRRRVHVLVFVPVPVLFAANKVACMHDKVSGSPDVGPRGLQLHAVALDSAKQVVSVPAHWIPEGWIDFVPVS